MFRIKRLLFIMIFVLIGQISAEPSQELATQLERAALERTQYQVTYDGRYLAIDYPNGDVPENIGVCTDVVIRSYRQMGIDLQQLVHEDMRENFSDYPALWGHSRPDTHIDHRRVPNLQTFFSRHGQTLTVSDNGDAYQVGDLVTWVLPGNLPHIGVVISERSVDGERPLIVHNVGSGTEISDFLFNFPITGHYRYFPSTKPTQEIDNTELISDLE